jgi:hypothetical protein
MTWTAAADAVMSACPPAVAARPGLACVRVPAHDPGFVPATARRPASHSRRPDHARPPVLHDPVGAPQRRKPGYVRLLHRHPLRGGVATLAGWPSDPGRDVLCLLTSPPRWFRWL